MLMYEYLYITDISNVITICVMNHVDLEKPGVYAKYTCYFGSSTEMLLKLGGFEGFRKALCHYANNNK